MLASQRPITPVQPALSHLRKARTQPQWQQWLLTNKAVLVATAGVLAVVAVASLLASRYQAAIPDLAADTQQLAAQNTTSEPLTGPIAAPFAQLSAAQAQQTAQDQLGRFVELQLMLEEKFTSTSWATDSIEQAKATALLGDSFFQNQNYREAFEQYQRAAAELDLSIKQGETAVASALAQAEQSIDQLDQLAASEALARARAYFPREPAIEQLQQRVDKLPQITELLRDALNLELAERYEQALERYQRIVAVDPKTESLKTRMSAAKAGLKRQRIRSLLSDAFNALNAANYVSARGKFTQVLAEEPDNSAAQGGLEQIAQLYDVAVIEAAQADAEIAMQAGDWSTAVDAYQRILDFDSNLLVGVAGLAAATEHQRIDKLLNAIRSAPERLSNAKLFNDAEIALSEAGTLAYQTEALATAIDAVKNLLAQYRDPVNVTFVSDNAMQISLSNIGNLGQFAQRTLTLRPGVYTLRASRDGCRDTYTNITVLPGMAPVEVFCSGALP